MKQFEVKRWFLVACWALLALMSEISYAQDAQCVNGVPETSNGDLFESDESGDILHLPTGLVFMRCAIGQVWDGTSCSGDARAMTWQEALQVSVAYDFEGSQNWRLPNIKELAVITERACVDPSLNTASFPQSPAGDFWTSTPSVRDPQRAWVVGFFNATTSLRAKDRSLFVRLVRTKLATE
ncbi:DUF1566 domain-containing protein [Glaciecola sp. XM2]|uniref:Lcl C-terminal domain-containing protein n=1 Tax=Glaciecola sp. XM2 TaxID=1914931 RepID=UPI00331BFD61